MCKGTVRAVCISEQRGTEKSNVHKALFVEDYGIQGDAHAGDWHRQISLLSYQKIVDFNRQGAGVSDGAFGENLVVEGLDFRSLPVGTRLYCGDVVLETTQIGKECHSHCDIFHRVGDCIMPREGVFARVRKGGTIAEGDEMLARLPERGRAVRAAVMTLSDKGKAGERRDESGPAAEEMLRSAGMEIMETLLLADEQRVIERELIRLSDGRQADLIVTTGGTGFSQRDCTPEATLAVATRNVPGIAEAIRAGSMQFTKRAMLGRGVSVIRNRTLIVNLPGSPKAVRESLELVLPELEHGIRLLQGNGGECAGTAG